MFVDQKAHNRMDKKIHKRYEKVIAIPQTHSFHCFMFIPLTGKKMGVKVFSLSEDIKKYNLIK